MGQYVSIGLKNPVTVTVLNHDLVFKTLPTFTRNLDLQINSVENVIPPGLHEYKKETFILQIL